MCIVSSTQVVSVTLPSTYPAALFSLIYRNSVKSLKVKGRMIMNVSLRPCFADTRMMRGLAPDGAEPVLAQHGTQLRQALSRSCAVYRKGRKGCSYLFLETQFAVILHIMGSKTHAHTKSIAFNDQADHNNSTERKRERI